MAKKIEVFEHEYTYLKQFHKESTLELAAMTADRDRWKQAYDELEKEYGKLAHKCGECCGCVHLNSQRENDERNLCQENKYDCACCTATCPCCNCVDGSNYEYSKKAKEI